MSELPARHFPKDRETPPAPPTGRDDRPILHNGPGCQHNLRGSCTGAGLRGYDKSLVEINRANVLRRRAVRAKPGSSRTTLVRDSKTGELQEVVNPSLLVARGSAPPMFPVQHQTQLRVRLSSCAMLPFSNPMGRFAPGRLSCGPASGAVPGFPAAAGAAGRRVQPGRPSFHLQLQEAET